MTDSAGTGEMVAISMERVERRFGRGKSLGPLSLHVPRGSVYGLVGPNGAGKSTIIRMLATLEPVDAGRIEVLGFDSTRHPAEIRQCVGFLPDVVSAYAELSVYEYLDFFGASHSLPARRRRTVIPELLELVDLAADRDAPVASLSRGMMQRLALARCLVHDPPVLLLDEPAAGLDPTGRMDLRSILRELASMGKTVLLSSHILPEVADTCSHIGVLNGGQLVAEGLQEALLAELGPQVTFRIELAHDSALGRAQSVLESLPPGEVAALIEPSILIAAIQHGDEAQVLAALLNAGVEVRSFAPEMKPLEELFLQLTGVPA